MTLKPIENEFSEILKEQLQNPETHFNLSLSGPVIDRLHPKMIWKQLELKRNPEQEALAIEIPGWFVDYFENSQEALSKYPALKIIEGRPWEVYRFLKGQEDKILFSFSPIGFCVLSRTPLESNPTHHLLPIWLSYALSPELWGTQGKWTRFHARLHELLKEKDLLNEGDYPGYYPLKKDAKKLEAFGFTGSDLDKSYVLGLPWSFPLTALEKLEQVIRQEF